MASVVVPESSKLLARIDDRVSEKGDFYIEEIGNQTSLLRGWLAYLDSYEKTGCADILLEGVGSAIVEVAACLSVGFARMALSSIRAQVDLVMSWLFFKDHPVEWRHLEENGNGFMQKSEIVKYLSERYSKKFKSRLAVLDQAKTRAVTDPFSLLSAHMHRQAGGSIAKIGACEEVVCSNALCGDVVVIQGSANEYLNDVLLACYAEQWASLDEDIIAAARSRLTPGQEAIVFS